MLVKVVTDFDGKGDCLVPLNFIKKGGLQTYAI